MMELFYLKLYQEIKDKNSENDENITKIIIENLKSLKIVTSLAPPFNLSSISAEFDLEKIFNSNSVKPFSIQAKELNDALNQSYCKLYIILDEVDRLSATHIINLLMFARTLEIFDNLICIVGIDYKQVINKIIAEKVFGLSDYGVAKSYLDKLFQAKFHIEISADKKIQFAIKLIKTIDTENVFLEMLESSDYKVRMEFGKIIVNLSTPRRIKKWIISIKINYSIVKNCPNKLDFISFLATSIVHPVITENISKHTLPILCRRYFKEIYIKDMYDINFISENNRNELYNEIIITSAGVFIGSKNENIEKLLNVVTQNPIKDAISLSFTKAFLLNTPVHFIILYAEGFADDQKISAYNDFFEQDINETLRLLLADNDSRETLALDLAETIRKNSLPVKGVPDLDLINRLWLNKINEEGNFGNPYESIILASLSNIAIEKLIENCCFSLSEEYLSRILLAHGIKNDNGSYDINKFNVPSDLEINKYHLSARLSIGKLKKILKIWIKNVEKNLSNTESEWYKQNILIGVFYRYIQWNKVLNKDSRIKLSKFLIEFLKDSTVLSHEKQKIKNLILDELEKFENGRFRDANPMEVLFKNNSELISLIEPTS